MSKSPEVYRSRTALTPAHGYTPGTIFMKRLKENTSSLAFTVGFILPTLNNINAVLESHVEEGEDVSLEELLRIATNAAAKATTLYADRLARVACQTGAAAVLIQSKNAYADSMVYLWDLYPRLHSRYVGEVLRAMRIPRFVITLLGVGPSEKDVQFLQVPASPLAAFEDSIKRNSIYMFGDIVVDTARILADKHVKSRTQSIKYQVISRVTSTVSAATGAAIGRLAAGERGEYWGEVAGMFIAPFATAKIVFTLTQLNFMRSSCSGRAHRSHRDGAARSSKPSSAAGSGAAPAPVAV